MNKFSTKVYHSATTDTGQYLEYRQSPLYVAFKSLRTWFWLPEAVTHMMHHRAIQRRINNGPWQYVQIGVRQ